MKEGKTEGRAVLPQIKALRGSARPDRDPVSSKHANVIDVTTKEESYPEVVNYPPAPDYMVNEDAVKEWDRVIRLLVVNRIMTEGELQSVAMLCNVTGQLIADARARRPINCQLMSQFRTLSNDFGFTPMSRLKTQKPHNPPSRNPFAKNGRQGQRTDLKKNASPKST
jgi:phage terminase small subunit